VGPQTLSRLSGAVVGPCDVPRARRPRMGRPAVTALPTFETASCVLRRAMSTLSRLLFLGAMFLLASCGTDRRQAAERTLREVGTPTLRREAASWYKGLFVSPNGQYFLPKIDQWPPAFRRFEPLRVRAYADGFGLALLDARNAEEGIYVVPWGMENTPREGRNARFQKIDEGIYWYWFTE